jgi:adenylosuccinate lyase
LRLRQEIAVGKISGAVGTYANIDPKVEAIACQNLGLTPDTASTQVISRDRHADYVQQLALLGASIERFAVEIRNLQRQMSWKSRILLQRTKRFLCHASQAQPHSF